MKEKIFKNKKIIILTLALLAVVTIVIIICCKQNKQDILHFQRETDTKIGAEAGAADDTEVKTDLGKETDTASESNTETGEENDTKAEANTGTEAVENGESIGETNMETGTGANTEVGIENGTKVNAETGAGANGEVGTKIEEAGSKANEETTTKPNTETATEVSAETGDTVNYILNHPGVLYTESEIKYMKYAVENKISPNYETWLQLLSSPLSGTDWTPRAVETVVRGGAGDNVSRLYIDVARAYQCALIWRISGDEAYGQTACRILNSWSATLKEVTGNADRYLASGLFGYQLANVSELMRDHPDFKIEQMENMLLNVFYYPLNERFLFGNQYGRDHNDAYISNYWANWDLCNMASAMAIGIFCDRKDIYNKAVEYYQSGLGNGSLYNAIPYVYEDGTAQWQESGRDQGHSNLGLGLMACICEMAWSQGDDLYGMAGNRLLKAAEYIAKYNNGDKVIFSEYEWGSGTKGDVKQQYVISEAGRGEVRPIWSMIYNHYVGRMGLSAPNITKRLEIIGYEYGAVSGGHATTYDQPGWGSLTYMGNTAVKSCNDVAENIAEGSYRIVSVHTGKVLSVDGNGNLCQRKKSNEESQWWKITYVGGGEYKLENKATGMAMTVAGCSYANGGIITTSYYNDKINQRFAILPADAGNFRIIASNSGKAIDIKDWSGEDNAVIFQWRYVMGNNQKWIFEKQ